VTARVLSLLVLFTTANTALEAVGLALDSRRAPLDVIVIESIPAHSDGQLASEAATILFS
jgi:hypothetical protein